MSKEYLEAFEVITGDNYHCDEETFYHNKAIVEQALQRLESIDNANPSEALKELNEIIEYITEDKKVKYKATILFDCEIIKQALIKAQEQEKKVTCWDIVVKKNVDLYSFKIDAQQLGLHFDFNYNYYKENCRYYHRGVEIELLTKEEFNLLKEVLE